jgi:hypothetical protein
MANVVCLKKKWKITFKFKYYLESFSNYVYPGEHEFSLYSCNTNDDCGDKETVICDYFNINSGYKVCKCRDGALLDPKTQKCSK